MKKIILSSLVFTALLSMNAFGQHNHRNLKIMEIRDQSEETVADPTQFNTQFSHDNLRLYPIIASKTFVEEHQDIGKFTLLKDAIETDKIAITETGARDLAEPVSNVNMERDVSGTVNTLYAKNTSTDTIFIMAGEVVKGGKQDRVIGQDIVLAPGEEKDLSAFCVEKSRWTTKESNGGKFTEYYNVSSMDIRQTVATDKEQSEVWRKVDEHTSKNGATSETHTYTNLENSEEYQQHVQSYMAAFEHAFDNDERVIGVIAVTGDKVMGIDMFATHDLFINTFPNLLHSYIGHAITHGDSVIISNEEVFAYLDKILKDEIGQKEVIEENGTIYEYKKKKLHISYY